MSTDAAPPEPRTEPPPSQPSDLSPSQPDSPEFAKILLSFFIVVGAALIVAVHLQSFLTDTKFDGALISTGLRAELQRTLFKASFERLFGLAAETLLGAWMIGSFLASLISWMSWRRMLWRSAKQFLYVGVIGLFELLWASGPLLHGTAADRWFATLLGLLPFFHAVAWGGLIAGSLDLVLLPERRPMLRRWLANPAVAWLAAAAFAATFATLGILQYRALMVPHGDTAMYEEHLWNLLHGKGFRSQLDSGRLFLGEHLEVIHILLIPIYMWSPSLPTLSVCLSLGLGSGAIAVRGITRRLTGSDGAANWLAAAYLLYFPLQYLNLEVSLKSFRPENLGVPLLLFALWSLEAGRYRTMLALMGLAVLAKEDYAIPIGMIGLYLAVRPGPRRVRLLGVGVFASSVVLLWFVLSVFIPYFRGAPPHYTAYFQELGRTPAEIVANAVRHPGVVANRLFTMESTLYLLTLTIAVGGLPLLGPSRLWTLAPTLVSILLIQLRDARSTFFHFHAPLVPIIFWAAAEGLNRFQMVDRRLQIGRTPAVSAGPQSATWQTHSTRFACFAAACALVSGFVAGKSPLSIAFYDRHAGQRGFARLLYSPGERVRRLEHLLPLIPLDARVAATDYVRPRFTHHRECHQYGEGGLKPHVPAETIDYIVVDLTGPFSDWMQGRAMKELRDKEHWETIYDDLFFFIVLRAKRESKLQTHIPTSSGREEHEVRERLVRIGESITVGKSLFAPRTRRWFAERTTTIIISSSSLLLSSCDPPLRQ
jgi:uncharacterized membrane protein